MITANGEKEKERERERGLLFNEQSSQSCAAAAKRDAVYFFIFLFYNFWAVVKIDRRECSNSNSRKIGTQHTIRLISSRGAAAVAAEEDSIDHWPL